VHMHSPRDKGALEAGFVVSLRWKTIRDPKQLHKDSESTTGWRMGISPKFYVG
jgi:hypothetical protein